MVIAIHNWVETGVTEVVKPGRARTPRKKGERARRTVEKKAAALPSLGLTWRRNGFRLSWGATDRRG